MVRQRWAWASASVGGIRILCGHLKSSCFETQVHQRSWHGFLLALFLSWCPVLAAGVDLRFLDLEACLPLFQSQDTFLCSARGSLCSSNWGCHHEDFNLSCTSLLSEVLTGRLWSYSSHRLLALVQIKALPYPLKVAQIREHCKVSSAV